MARVIEYNMNDVLTDTDGTRKLDNVGTSGATNDGVLNTGQMLEFDGVGQSAIVDTSSYNGTVFSFKISVEKTSSTTIYMLGVMDGSTRTGVGVYSGNIIMFYKGNVHNLEPYTDVPDGISTLTVTIDGLNLKYYRGKNLLNTITLAEVGYWGSTLTAIGDKEHSDTSYHWDTKIGDVVFSSAIFSQTDIDYMIDNPEALVAMSLGGTDVSLSFATSDILHHWTMNEGLNSYINDIKNSTTADILNYASTMWTNADQQAKGLQNALLKRDANGVPTGLVDINTNESDAIGFTQTNLTLPTDSAWSIEEVLYYSGAYHHHVYSYDGVDTVTPYIDSVAQTPALHTPTSPYTFDEDSYL